ncbi:MAG: hypothetical protein ABSC02_01175 [Acidobacteriota bacterium]|jgi:hypothetical protein
MSPKQLYSQNRKAVWPMAAFLFLCTIVFVVAQTSGGKPSTTITIDGAQTPERIPDWILWRELFRRVSMFSDQSATQGKEIWVDKLHLTMPQMNELLQRASDHRDMDAAKNAAAQSLKASKAETKDTLRLKLRQSQMNKEVLTLQLRDGLRARIGEDAFNRLLSYARINIAPTIKVGKIAVPK